MKLNDNLKDCINDLYKLQQLYKENFLINDFLHDNKNKLCDCLSVNKNESKIITRWLVYAIKLIDTYEITIDVKEKRNILKIFIKIINKLINNK